MAYEHDGDNAWDDENEDEEDEPKQRPESLKENLIFLIDAQGDMFEEIELYNQTTTSFEAARRAVVELIKLKAIQHPDDQVAVILYNTKEKDKPAAAADAADSAGGGGVGSGSSSTYLASFEGVRTLLDLQPPSVEAVKTVRDLSVASFQARIGSLPNRRDAALADALFRVQHCLTGGGGGGKGSTADRWYNTVVVFTNDPDPCGTGPAARDMIDNLGSRVEALQGYGVRLRLFPLAAAVRPFESGRLWQGLLRSLRGAAGGEGGGEGESGGGEEGGEAEDDESLLRELASDPSTRPDPSSAITSLFDSFKRRLSRKRTVMRLRWEISEQLGIPLKGYLLISDEAKAAKKTIPLNPTTNQPLKTVTTLVSTSDGRVVEREEVGRRKAFRLKTGNTERMPEVLLPASEAAQSGPVPLCPPGLRLLGFKPLGPPGCCLRRWHQLRPPLFLRPDEGAAEGATAAFIALWRAMLAEERFAVCSYKRANTVPQLVALVPVDEAVDVYGMQTQPPGLHMIYLPYLDDVRQPETVTGLPRQQPTDEQLSAAAQFVSALSLEAVEPFDLTQIANPWLQRHYQILEAIALSEEIPPWHAASDDPTRPNPQLFTQPEALGAAEAFRAAFPQGGGGRGSAKRKAEGEAGGRSSTGPRSPPAAA
ncbi:hypothetical protein Agub_g7565 [Astrephomene gubernaculifera]|uniref:VWFA domain-containing protein n=1 Tax=Astrephomene gubernaculifera TaxID=47775 RepID=A0AAD3DUH4_9CHLO|nr:hypothetical protein Agub_g7565 [Astrephomene gubernaculifera]